MRWPRKRSGDDFSAEIQSHLEIEVQRLEQEGLSPEDARAQARRAFGNVVLARERFHYSQRAFWIEQLVRELKYAVRRLGGSPIFTLAALFLLILGIGSNLAVFRLVDWLFLRPIPVDRPSELVSIVSIDQRGERSGIPSKVLDALRAERMFQGVCGFTTPRLAVEIDGNTQSIGTLPMTGDCFSTLGIRMQIGRPFSVATGIRGAANAAILTDALWRGSFGANPNVLGRKILVQGVLFTVIGVAEPRFTGLLLGYPPGLILPLDQTPLDFVPTSNRPVYFWVSIAGRRAAGVPLRQVQARLKVIEKTLLSESVPLRYNEAQRRDYLARRIVAAPVETGFDWHLRERFGQPLVAIMAVCGSVLLIACVNLMSLLLARGLSRRKEIAVRLALGARRGSVWRMLALENILLIAGGVLGGLILSQWLVRLVASGAGRTWTNLAMDFPMDSRLLIFLGSAGVALILLFGAMPMWQLRRTHPNVIREGGRGVIGASANGQKILLGLQLGFTLALVTASVLLSASFRHLDDMSLGMKTHGVSEAMLVPVSAGYGKVSPAPYYHRLLENVEALPDVASVSLSSYAPLWMMDFLEPVTCVEDRQACGDLQAQSISVTREFFATLGMSIVAGSDFAAGDEGTKESTAIVSQSLARRWNETKLIGRHIRIGNMASTQNVKVIGIASDVQLSFADPNVTRPLVVYINYWQHPEAQKYPTLLVKYGSAGTMLTAPIRRLVQSMGREYVERFLTMDDAKDQALIENRLMAYLASAFGGLALILAATGLFGLLSYQVASRTGEIGIRIALGATAREIRFLVLRQISPILIAGIAAGLLLTLATAKLATGLVYGIQALDPRPIAASVALLLFTALAAAWLPAHRACSIDPVTALRRD